jgi:hypothetical protein
VKENFLIAVEILTPDRRLLDYGFLEAKKDSLRLVTTRFKGTVLGGAILVMFSSAYWFLIGVPFLFFHVDPITRWNPIPEVLVAVAVPAGFMVLLVVSMRLVRRIQIRYPRTSRDVTVSNVQPGRFDQTMTTRAGTDNLILVARGRRAKFLDAMALAGAF